MFIKNRLKSLGVAGKSLSISFISQLTTSVISFVMVPLLIQYLNKDNYGLWVTLISLVSWILASDFGIGYGFRNRVTEFLANGDRNKLNAYFKNTFQYYIIITVFIIAFFTYCLFYNYVLSQHKLLSLIIYLPYIFYFPFSIANQILQGLRYVHYTAIISLLRAIMWAFCIILLINIEKEGQLLYVAVCYSTVNSIINAISVYLAFTKSTIEVPNIKALWSRPVLDSTLMTGAKFFILQISTLLLFSMGNYYVYSNLTPTDTTYYDTINKMYTLYMTFFNMIISVFWSEIVFQKTNNDFPRLRKTYKKLVSISILVSLGSILLIWIGPLLISIWTNKKILVSSKDCMPFSFLISIQTLAYAGAVFLNAFEKVMPQVILAIANIVLIYPLIKLGFRYNIGLGTVPFMSAILSIPALFICHYTALRLINFKNPLHV